MPDIWFAPFDRQAASQGISDFDAIFSPNWVQDPVLSKIRVFKFYPADLAKLPEVKLKAILQFLSAHNVKIAFETSMLMPVDACGSPYAGDGGQWTIDILKRVKQWGLTIDYLAMNEPFLHAFRTTQAACPNSAVHVALDSMAPTLAAAHNLFPSILIGDIEPVAGDAKMQPYMHALQQWLQAYEQHSGQRPAFFHIDIDSNRPNWLEGVSMAAQISARTRIPLGIIYNGKDTDASARDWVANGIAHYKALKVA